MRTTSTILGPNRERRKDLLLPDSLFRVLINWIYRSASSSRILCSSSEGHNLTDRQEGAVFIVLLRNTGDARLLHCCAKRTIHRETSHHVRERKIAAAHGTNHSGHARGFGRVTTSRACLFCRLPGHSKNQFKFLA